MPARSHLAVAALTVVGGVLRVVVAHQSIFADELSTHFVVVGRGLGDVLSTVHTDYEITPPLYFVLTWLSTQLGDTPELLRLPSLVAGVATIPLVYVLGLRTVGRRAALVGAALATFSPFLIYYSGEARGYELMVALVLLSTLAMLAAVDSGRTRWWVAYAICACAAVYTHYTSVFALAGQFGWVLWTQPAARRPALIATGAAVVGFLPWLSGLKSDLESTTTDILSALQPFTATFIRQSFTHWAVGYPYATPISRIRDLPGTLGLALIAAGCLIAIGGHLARRVRWRVDRRVALVIVLLLSVPVGETIASAIGSNLLGTRNLAASWPAFALCVAAFLVSAGRRTGTLAATLVVAAFAYAAVLMLGPDFRKPDFNAVAAFIDDHAAPGDILVDGANLSPAGIPTPLDATTDKPHPRAYLNVGKVQYDPFKILTAAPPPADVARRTAAEAHGQRLFVVLAQGSPTWPQVTDALAPRYRVAETRTYPGIVGLEVRVFERRQ